MKITSQRIGELIVARNILKKETLLPVALGETIAKRIEELANDSTKEMRDAVLDHLKLSSPNKPLLRIEVPASIRSTLTEAHLKLLESILRSDASSAVSPKILYWELYNVSASSEDLVNLRMHIYRLNKRIKPWGKVIMVKEKDGYQFFENSTIAEKEE